MTEADTQVEMRPITFIGDEPDHARNAMSVGASNPHDMMRLALAQGVDLDRLERIYDLTVKHDKAVAKNAFIEAMTAFKAMPLTIFKRKHVGYTTNDGEFVGYAHAELSDITDVLEGPMSMHGLTYDWDIVTTPALVTVTCIVTHVRGHEKRVTMSCAPDTSGKKNAIQSLGSGSQYLERYTLLAAVGKSTKGMDDDGRGAGDRDEEDRRRKWIEDQKDDIKAAATVGAVKSVMAYALKFVHERNDKAAEDELLEAQSKKFATLPQSTKGAKA